MAPPALRPSPDWTLTDLPPAIQAVLVAWLAAGARERLADGPATPTPAPQSSADVRRTNRRERSRPPGL